jgi:hypothetical protein
MSFQACSWSDQDRVEAAALVQQPLFLGRSFHAGLGSLGLLGWQGSPKAQK